MTAAGRSERAPSSAPAERGSTSSRPAPDGPAPRVTAQEVLSALTDVTDPEWPVSIVDMGLVYGVDVEDGAVTLTLTFTATACPCMEMIQDDVRERLLRLRGVREVKIVVSWDPPWSKARLSEKARRELIRCGVAV